MRFEGPGELELPQRYHASVSLGGTSFVMDLLARVVGIKTCNLDTFTIYLDRPIHNSFADYRFLLIEQSYYFPQYLYHNVDSS